MHCRLRNTFMVKKNKKKNKKKPKAKRYVGHFWRALVSGNYISKWSFAALDSFCCYTPHMICIWEGPSLHNSSFQAKCELSLVKLAVISQIQMALISLKAGRVLQGIRHSASVLVADRSNSFKLFFISLYHLTAEADMVLLSALTRLLICVSISHTGMWSHTQCPFFDWRKPKDKAGAKNGWEITLGSGMWFRWHYWRFFILCCVVDRSCDGIPDTCWNLMRWILCAYWNINDLLSTRYLKKDGSVFSLMSFCSIFLTAVCVRRRLICLRSAQGQI